MSFGLDYVSAPSIEVLRANHVAFVCRYLSEVNDATKIKLLTLEEAKADSEAGIALVSNYEWTGQTPLGGHSAGVYDAQIAASQHTACGGPADRPIYFSVDFGATADQMAAIGDYFRGVASVIGLHRTGAYGSYSVIKDLFDNGLITWGWQTYAWSGGLWDARAYIRQYENGVMLAGKSVDYNESNGMRPDFGQWAAQGGNYMFVPSGWKDDGKTLTAPNGVPVVLGFRQHILNTPAWNPENVPLEAEYEADPVLRHNPPVGPGQRQCFRDGMLWYTPTHGVIYEPEMGAELDAAYKALAAQKAVTPIDKTKLNADIQALQADVNAL